jgi:hypothetical protein
MTPRSGIEEPTSAFLSLQTTLESHTRTLHLMDVAKRARLCGCLRRMAHRDGSSTAWIWLLALLAIG